MTDERVEPEDNALAKSTEAGLRGSRQPTAGSITMGLLGVAAPAILSILRLWVEAGGDLQTTLLLVENVPPLNLVAALVVTTTWLFAAVSVAVLAVGGVLLASGGQLRGEWWFAPARWSAGAPPWFKALCFLLAALTWQIVFLPMLLLAWCAAYQVSVRMPRKVLGSCIAAVLLTGYFVTLSPILRDAWASKELLVPALLVLPPLLALTIAGPLIPQARQLVAILATVGAAAVLGWAAFPSFAAPVLPLSVVVVTPSGPVGSNTDATLPQYLRGSIVGGDGSYTIVLREHGGVHYVPRDRIVAQFLCPTEEELTPYRFRFHGLLVSDSLLRGIGRTIRPPAEVAPACRAAPD